jgi:hypothetical protein
MSAPCPVFGFVVTITPREVDDPTALDPIIADLMTVLDADGLEGVVGGGGAKTIAVRREGSQATDQDRQLVREWSARWSGAANVTIGPIVDLGSSA